MDLVLTMATNRMAPRRALALIGVLGLLLAIPVPRAMAHDYCVHQGYDWGCVTNQHARWTACDAEKEGNRVYTEAWHRTPQGYYNIHQLWDWGGADGKCAVGVTGQIDKLAVCEVQPVGPAKCEYGP